MNRAGASGILGVLLVVGGILLLLRNLGFVNVAGDATWAVIFAAAGTVFVVAFIGDRDTWWPVIPGFTLLALAAILALHSVAPRSAATWSGPIILGGIGLSFAVVYLTHPENRWPIIPAGVLLTLATVAGLPSAARGPDTGSVFFLGLAMTFGRVYLLPGQRQRRAWAAVVAGVCLAIALAAGLATRAILGYLWPAVLILAGLYLVYRALRAQQA